MLRPVLTIMFVLFCQYAICHSYQYTAEKAVALNKLREIGVNVAKVNLSIVENTGELCVFEDSIHNTFVIVASSKYHSFLDDLVLAYGADSRFQGTESAWKQNLLAFYAHELTNLKCKGNNKKKINGIHFEPVNSIDVKPLVKTRWGQTYPYNSLCPQTRFSLSNKLTGCVATAMSQIMPSQPYTSRWASIPLLRGKPAG